jgi:hypothetical protein
MFMAKLNALLSVAAGVLFVLDVVLAQQFSNTAVEVNFTGLSAPCLSALQGSITCDDSLPTAIWNPSVYLSSDQLTSLCIPVCESSLQSYLTSVAGACAATDVIVAEGIAYPASYRPKEYIYNYGIYCRKDK